MSATGITIVGRKRYQKGSEERSCFGLFFVGGLLVGLAVGEFVGNRQAGALLGVGLALLAQGVASPDAVRKWFNR